MNKQEIEKAIYVMKNIKHLLVDVIGNKNNEKELDMAISALEQQLTGGWIPVSERMPEKSKDYLTFWKDGFGNQGQQVFHWDNERKGFYPKWTSNPSRHEYAWRPLPEPYKEG